MKSLTQQTEEWLEMRRDKIGSSDAPVIMGVVDWKTPYELWEEKLGIRQPQKASTCMKRGLDLEEKARQKFQEKTGIVVFPQVLFHPDYHWMMASLDGMDFEQKFIVEIKCPGKEDHKLALEGKIPEKYYPQLQHQMEVASLDMAYYFSFDGENGVILECRRNTKYIQEMIEKELRFYKCMQDFIAPELSNKDYIMKTDKYWEAYALEWLDIQKEMENLQKREQELRTSIIELSNNHSCIGGGIRVRRCISKGQIDYSKIPELHGVDLERYRKEPQEKWYITKA